MKIKAVLLFALIIFSCSKNVNYTPEIIKETLGRYVYSQEEVIDVYYDNNKLYLKWKGADKIETVAFDEHTFFVAEMYKKLRFVKHPQTKEAYLGIVSEDKYNKVDYAYLKVADTFKTPRMYLKDKEYDKALAGYLAIKQQDSTSVFLEEASFNRLGYNLLNEKAFNDAISVFKINVVLYPNSDNVYDSLADAYLRKGDSTQAYTNYKKALELNTGNRRAKRFVESYNTKL